MANLLRIAWRNLLRSRARTLLSLGAVLIGAAVVVLFKGFTDGMINTTLQNYIELSSGHVRVIKEEYRKKERLLTLSHPVDGFQGEGYSSMARAFAQLPGVERAFGRLRFGALLAKGEETHGAIGIGVEPAAEEAEVRLSRFIDQGRFVREGQKELVLGRVLLEKLGLRVGDKVTLVCNDSFGSLRAATYTVVGRLNSGLRLLDEGVAYLPLDVAQNLLRLEGGVTEIVVYGEDERDAERIQKAIQAMLHEKAPDRGYLAVPWHEHNAFISYLVSNARAIYFLIYAFVVLLASFVIFNTFLMIVNERKREIGLLGAMGFTQKEILYLFLAEAAIIGLAGSLAGATAGGLITWWLSSIGLDMSVYATGMSREVLFSPVMYPEISAGSVLLAFFLSWGASVLAGAIPARQAARLDPTQALRSL
ncbi:MAG: ABC transporter permease [Bacillota bacterium]|nr:ABC transporter permease [Bacillota bacterium]